RSRCFYCARVFTLIGFSGYNAPRLGLGPSKEIEEETVGQMKKLLGILVVGGLLAASGFAFSQSSDLTAAMKTRLAPVGTLCKAGESCAAAPVAAASSGPRSGKEVYDASCGTCHGIGVAGAPKFGDATDWGVRLGKGIETLYTH